MHDLAIIGGGPAGIAAGVYASRKQLKTIFITKEWGGQSVVSAEIQNWIGTISLSGDTLAKSLKTHLEAYKADIVDIHEHDCVIKLEAAASGFSLTTEQGSTFASKTVLIATGAYRRKLDVPGASEFEQKGLTYCASCDGPLFSDEDVAVIGGGNAGFETAAQLLAYATSVLLINRSNDFKADPVTIKKVLAHPNMKVLTNTDITEIRGEQFVTGLTYKNTETGKTGDAPVAGIFVEIGMIPNTDFAKDIVRIDDYKRVVVDPKNQKTSTNGIWAAGDCTNELYHQNNIAAGDAVKALEDIYNYLHAA